MQTEIKVSVICNAYNHGKFIRDALDGFVMQKTNFAFEVLVHDDASSDNTADIIREYEAKYPNIIKPIYQTENQYSKNGISQFQFPRVKGKYVAFCEGDDYWTDPLKLQKQFDAMEAHPEIDICAHHALRVHAQTGKLLNHISPSPKDTILTVEDVILGGGGYVTTASLFFKASVILQPKQFRQFLLYDYTLQIQGALGGGMLYLSDCMSIYRASVSGSWSDRMSKNREKLAAHREKIAQMLTILNEETNGKYSAAIRKKILLNEIDHLLEEDRAKEVLTPQYAEIYRELPIKKRFTIKMKALFPRLITTIRKLKSRR